MIWMSKVCLSPFSPGYLWEIYADRAIDQAWLETVNAERKKDQSGAITYEVFEIIMDKLEKEWFNLVSYLSQIATYSRGRAESDRLSVYLNQLHICPLKIQNVQYVMMEKERIQMLLFSVMDVI